MSYPAEFPSQLSVLADPNYVADRRSYNQERMQASLLPTVQPGGAKQASLAVHACDIDDLIRKFKASKETYEYDNIKFTANVLYQGYDLDRVLFSQATVMFIKQKCEEYLIGAHPEGKRIVIAPKTVLAAINFVYLEYRKPVGDIRGGEQVVDYSKRDDLQAIINRAISLIVSDIQNELGIIANNQKMSIWSNTLGDANPWGVTFFEQARIKMNEKRNTNLLFNMRY